MIEFSNNFKSIAKADSIIMIVCRAQMNSSIIAVGAFIINRLPQDLNCLFLNRKPKASYEKINNRRSSVHSEGFGYKLNFFDMKIYLKTSHINIWSFLI